MRKIFFIAFILTGQLFAQMEEGLYYSDDIYICDVDMEKRTSIKKLDAHQYIDISKDGIRLYDYETIGVYHAWKYIGYFIDHETYLLSNGSKICIGPEIRGIYYFYESEYDYYEYKKLIEFRNLTRVLDEEDHVDYGDYLMEQ